MELVYYGLLDPSTKDVALQEERMIFHLFLDGTNKDAQQVIQWKSE